MDDSGDSDAVGEAVDEWDSGDGGRVIRLPGLRGETELDWEEVEDPEAESRGREGLSDLELAYLAGVLDTRAVVRIRLVGGSGARQGVMSSLPYLALSCGDAELLDWLCRLTGVKSVVTTRTYDKHRCLEHCEESHDHVQSTSGRWSVSGSRATVLLSATLPYVRLQEDRWRKALQAGLSADRKEAVAQKMSALGWPLPLAWTAL